MIQIFRLAESLTSAGLRVRFAKMRLDADRSKWPEATFVERPDELIRLDWLTPPTPADITKATNIVVGHDGNQTEAERFDDVELNRRVLAANTLLLQILYLNIPEAERPAVPAWVRETMREAVQKIRDRED